MMTTTMTTDGQNDHFTPYACAQRNNNITDHFSNSVNLCVTALSTQMLSTA